MDLLFEIILELLSEGVSEASRSSKVPKPLRYACIVLIILFFSATIGLILFCGISLLKENTLGGIFFIALGLVMMVMSICKFRKVYLSRQSERANLPCDPEKD
ncbi:MAG: hypothetical protein E7331_10890 [Clostridiales bacterium]|nr:hypothetical protein [Clostridiales bacterium]